MNLEKKIQKNTPEYLEDLQKKLK